MSTRTATLRGARRRPVLELKFDRYALIPGAAKLPKYPEPKFSRPGRKSVRRGRPKNLQDWVMAVPGRRFDKPSGLWVVHNPGPDADRVLAELGFEVDLSHGAKGGVRSLADLATPLIEVHPEDPWVTRVHPRFSDVGDQMPAGSEWDRDELAWLVYTPDMRHVAASGIDVPPEILDLGEQLVAQISRGRLGASRPDWPMLLGLMPRAPKKFPDGLPLLPSWCRFQLYGYQTSGSYAVVGGHNFLADVPGLGKTVQSIAAHALVCTQRLLIVTPPVALTNWVREVAGYGLAFPAGDPDARPGAPTSVMISPGRKVPAFPDKGVVVVADSLLKSRPELLAQVLEWAPDGITIDESHRHKHWATGRSRVVRRVAQSVTGLRIPLSGTAMTSNPVELAAQLAMSGHLDTVFGGLHDYLTTFARQDRYGRWLPRMNALPLLRKMLDEQVWVRRFAEDVYNRDPNGPTMPPVLPPRAKYVDVDLSGYRAALEKQNEVVDEWLDDLGRVPTDEEVDEFAATNIGFISPLRKAAGLAKIPAAVEIISDWIAAQDEAGADRPLLVWTHHQEVTEAMRSAIAEAGADVAVIDGGTSATARGKITAEFQAGRYKALVLSLQAAGVALTLTRASDNLFVESDWEPTTLTQARDRTKRIGQTRSVSLTTLIAAGTLDEHLQRVQRNKAEVLDPVMGSGNDTSVAHESTDDLLTVSGVIGGLVRARVQARPRRRRPARQVALAA